MRMRPSHCGRTEADRGRLPVRTYTPRWPCPTAHITRRGTRTARAELYTMRYEVASMVLPVGRVHNTPGAMCAALPLFGRAQLDAID